MRITLDELRDCINKYGVIDEMCQGEYTILRESPYVKTYNTMIQRYTTVNDKLLALLPKEVIKEVDPTFNWAYFVCSQSNEVLKILGLDAML